MMLRKMHKVTSAERNHRHYGWRAQSDVTERGQIVTSTEDKVGSHFICFHADARLLVT